MIFDFSDIITKIHPRFQNPGSALEDPLGVSPSKGNQGATRGKEKILLTSVGIEPTTSALDLPLPVVGSIPTEVKRIFCLPHVVP